MKIRTLVSNQLYFGLEPLVFRRGAGRALTRVNGAPIEDVRISAQTLGKDFRLDAAAADAFVSALLSSGLLQPFPGHPTGYRLTERFAEFALARVVPPLPRARAKELLIQACQLAAKINADWTANPLMIHMVAVSGGYMSRNSRIAELTLWPVVKRRVDVRARRFGASTSKADGASEISAALRALSSFILVKMVADKTSIERPFAVPFRDHVDALMPPPSAGRLWAWSSSLRRQLTGR
jgi:hypothetical protein